MIQHTFEAMGTRIEAWCADRAAVDDLEGWFELVEEICSRFRPESELSRINASPLPEVTISPLLQGVLKEATWAREATERGAGEVLLTSMDRDGTTDGYDLELTRAVAAAVTVPVIASGGAGELRHLTEGILEGGADAVLCASIFHYGTHSIREAKQHLHDAGIPVRFG